MARVRGLLISTLVLICLHTVISPGEPIMPACPLIDASIYALWWMRPSQCTLTDGKDSVLEIPCMDINDASESSRTFSKEVVRGRSLVATAVLPSRYD